MNTLPAGYGGPGPSDPSQYGTANARIDHNVSARIYGHSNQNVGNMSNYYNNTINVGVNEELSRIAAWLSPLEPGRRHQDVSNRRLDGVGDWVLQRNEFESWRNSQDGSPNPTLRCYGDQGVGKTYIRYEMTLQELSTMLTSDKTSSLVIDTLCEQAQGQNIAVLFFYCDYQAQKGQSAVNMIGGLLRQVISGGAGIPGEIQRAFNGLGWGGGKCLRLPDMLELFVKVSNSIERVYICVDAVDELLPQDRSELLRALRQIIQDAPNTRLFLTGRPYIRRELDNYLSERAHVIKIIADQGDIARYVGRKMDDDNARDPDLMTDALRNNIMETMLEKASEM